MIEPHHPWPTLLMLTIPGPGSLPRQAIDGHGAFRTSFGKPTIGPDELRRRLATPPPPLRQLGVRELVPPSQIAAYDQIIRAERAGLPLLTLPERPTYAPAEPPPRPHDAASNVPHTAGSALPEWFNMQNASTGHGGDALGVDPIFGVPSNYGAARTAAKPGGGGGPDDECRVA
jgi:hypothetical protein